MLDWKKRKDGSAIAVHDGHTYHVRFRLRKNLPAQALPYRETVLFVDEQLVYLRWHDGGDPRKACKRQAELIAAGHKPLAPQVIKEVKKLKDPAVLAFVRRAIDLGDLEGVREVKETPDQKKVFDRLARAGNDPWAAHYHYATACKGTQVKQDELSADLLDSAKLKRLAVLAPVQMERSRVQQEEYNRQTANSVKKEAKANKEVVAPEEYKGNGPERRSREGKLVMYSVVKHPDCPEPTDAKFSTLLQWSEDVRDLYAKHSRYVTPSALMGLISHHFFPHDPLRKAKAVNRLRLVHRQELDEDSHRTKSLMAEAVKQVVPTDGKAAGKDRFGNRVGSSRAKVNAVLSGVPKSADRIMQESDTTNMTSYLKQMLDEKKLVVSKKWKRKGEIRYRLADNWKEEKPATAGKSIPGKK